MKTLVVVPIAALLGALALWAVGAPTAHLVGPGSRAGRSMTTLDWAKLAATLVVVTLGSCEYGKWKEGLRAEGRAEILAERVDSLRGEAATDSIRADSLERVAFIASERADSIAKEKQAEVDELRSRRPEVVERIVREAGPDSVVVREAIEQVEADIWIPQVSALELALVAEREARQAVEVERDGLRGALQAERALRASIEAMHAEHMRSHTILDTTVGKLVLAGGSFALGWKAGGG